MKLELRNISYNARLSEETPAYSAVLYVDGVRAATVMNHGQGGCDMTHFLDREVEKRVTAYFAALPKKVCKTLVSEGKPFEYPPTLEDWCQTEVGIVSALKSLRRRKKLTGFHGGKEYEWKIAAKDATTEVRQKIGAKFPGVRFIDELSDATLRTMLEAA